MIDDMTENMELTNRLRKEVASLGTSKGRKQLNCFVVEGTKCVLDTIDSFVCRHLFATSQWIAEHGTLIGGKKVMQVTRNDIERMSQLRTPQDVIAVYEIPEVTVGSVSASGGLMLALDGVQDPGNLGTIIRVADWFGITTILCSHDTVDVYNPKVVQATMGAISRVRVVYCDLVATLRTLQCPVYGTFLDGDNIYDARLGGSGVIVMGNEGNGISHNVADVVTHRLLIPSYPSSRVTSESLNVAMATGLVLGEFRRRQIN